MFGVWFGGLSIFSGSVWIHRVIIANLRYPANNDKFFAGERRYSHSYQVRLVRISFCPSKIDLVYSSSHHIPQNPCIYIYTGWWFQPFWKIWKSVGIIIPNIWKNKNVPNHHHVFEFNIANSPFHGWQFNKQGMKQQYCKTPGINGLQKGIWI